jgi:hypothetical protein
MFSQVLQTSAILENPFHFRITLHRPKKIIKVIILKIFQWNMHFCCTLRYVTFHISKQAIFTNYMFSHIKKNIFKYHF